MTVAEFIELHDLCCELLHATNPYSSDEQKYEDLIGSAQTWLRKIMELLSHHAIGPSGTDLMFIIQMGHENQNPSPSVDGSNPAISGHRKSGHFRRPETGVEFYLTAPCVGKVVWTLVRQLRGPHFSTCA